VYVLCTVAGDFIQKVAKMNLYQIEEILKVIKEIRASDCGAWLKDCGSSMFTCADGREKRQELSRLLDKLYRVSKI
jgi:hypothetical protein